MAKKKRTDESLRNVVRLQLLVAGDISPQAKERGAMQTWEKRRLNEISKRKSSAVKKRVAEQNALVDTSKLLHVPWLH